MHTKMNKNKQKWTVDNTKRNSICNVRQRKNIIKRTQRRSCMFSNPTVNIGM